VPREAYRFWKSDGNFSHLCGRAIIVHENAATLFSRFTRIVQRRGSLNRNKLRFRRRLIIIASNRRDGDERSSNNLVTTLVRYLSTFLYAASLLYVAPSATARLGRPSVKHACSQEATKINSRHASIVLLSSETLSSSSRVSVRRFS
jgi:hypothetical protein